MKGVTGLIVQTMTRPERQRFERLSERIGPDEAAQQILLDRPRLKVSRAPRARVRAAVDDSFQEFPPDGDWVAPFIDIAMRVPPVLMTGSGTWHVAPVSAGMILLGNMPKQQAEDFVRRRPPTRLIEIEVAQDAYEAIVARLSPKPDAT